MAAMSSLRRTESLLFLPAPAETSHPPYPCYTRKRQLNADGGTTQLTIQTRKRKKRSSVALTTTTTTPKHLPPKIILPSQSSPRTTLLTPRTSSPLSPTGPIPLPGGRPVFPRSKPEPDLYKTAIKMRMLATPEGQKLLNLGPRLALDVLTTRNDILNVTRELESIVKDITMDEDQQHHQQQSEDWEMLDATL